MSFTRRPGLPACLAALLMVLVASSVSASAAPVTGRNLLANPGFETPLAGHPWMPAAWDTFQSGLSTVFFGRDTFLVHGGRYAVSVANLSTSIPMFHNWSQTLLVGREMWGKDLVFSVWTRSTGLEGRAYILLQAYRDTITKMSRIWKIDREAAKTRMGILPLDDPLMPLGWKRQYFSDSETDWVRREVRIFVPPSSNVLIVRCGIFGTGQVMFDDASLVALPAAPVPPVPLNTNLLSDPGFEGNGDAWEYSLPPYEGLVITRDTTVFHSGHAAIRMEGGLSGMVSARAGVCQLFTNRDLGGKRLRVSAWIKTDSLMGEAWVAGFGSTIEGDLRPPGSQIFGGTTDWTPVSMEFDVGPGTYMVAAWFMFSAPAQGKLYYDDCSFEVVGPARYLTTGEPPPRPRVVPGR